MLRKWLVAAMAVAFVAGALVGCEPKDEPTPEPKVTTEAKVGTEKKAETAPAAGTDVKPGTAK